MSSDKRVNRIFDVLEQSPRAGRTDMMAHAMATLNEALIATVRGLGRADAVRFVEALQAEIGGRKGADNPVVGSFVALPLDGLA